MTILGMVRLVGKAQVGRLELATNGDGLWD